MSFDDNVNLFFQNPCLEAFDNLLKQRDAMPREDGISLYHLDVLLALAEQKYKLGTRFAKDIEEITAKIDLILNPKTVLQPLDLDICWSAYRVTKDLRYPKRVSICMTDSKQPALTRYAARWSYDLHVRQGKL